MYIKSSSIESNLADCRNCNNEDICKCETEAINASKEASQIKVNPLGPIKVRVTCDRFTRKAQKQDGIFNYRNAD